MRLSLASGEKMTEKIRGVLALEKAEG